MKRASLMIMGIVLLFLTACGGNGVSESTVLGKIGDKEFTDEGYLEILQKEVSPMIQQELFLNEVMKSLAEEETKDKIFKQFKDDIEQTEGVSLEEYNLEIIEENAAIRAGMIYIFTELGYVTDEKIKEAYETNKEKVTVDTIVLLEEDAEHLNEVEAILEAGEDVQEKLDELGSNIVVESGVEYNPYTIPYEFMGALEGEKGDIFKREEHDATFLTKIVDMGESTLEELEPTIIVETGLDELNDVVELIHQLEDKGYIKLNDELREYLLLDQEEQD